jgi:hypothetical protein
MKKKCPQCNLVNQAVAARCLRCESALVEVVGRDRPARRSFLRAKLWRRAVGCVAVTALTLLAFYLSLVLTAKSLEYEERRTLEKSILVLEEKGFADDIFLLRYLAVYRGNDNWLNASTRLENAYAATNFPFEVMTIYPDFFLYPKDDLERAAILLHEAQHLKGADEKTAYEYVWKNRRRLGWTRAAYGSSTVWRGVRKQTRDLAPELFTCAANEFGDCTESN